MRKVDLFNKCVQILTHEILLSQLICPFLTYLYLVCKIYVWSVHTLWLHTYTNTYIHLHISFFGNFVGMGVRAGHGNPRNHSFLALLRRKYKLEANTGGSMPAAAAT